MDFTQIFHGMVGRDFIKAFNDNFIITDRTFLEILATLIYKVKSTDIKEFKVIDNVVSYTLEEAPADGEEDTRTWTPVDITKWGNIEGDIQDQEDLWNILEDKAAVDTVETLSNLLTTLNNEYQATKIQVDSNTSGVRANTNNISDILEILTEKVNSTNIKAIRLNNAIFQWSPDGRTWYEQPIVTSIAWGHLTGDITTQEDLMQKFDEINNQFTELDGTITGINNSISALQNSLNTTNTALNSHIEDFNGYKTEVSDAISLVDDKAGLAKDIADIAQDGLNAHILDENNPHHITKETIELANVDNTHDLDKPLSRAQKAYVDEQVEEAKREVADKSGLVNASGLANTLFVGTESVYGQLGPKPGVLALVLDTEYLTGSLVLTAEVYTDFNLYLDNNIIEPSDTGAAMKSYYDLEYGSSGYKVRVNVEEEIRYYDITIWFNRLNAINVDNLVNGDAPEPNEDELEGGNE